MRITSYILRFLSIGLYGYMMYTIYRLINPEIWNLSSPYLFFVNVFHLFSYFMLFLAGVFAYQIGVGLSSMTGSALGSDQLLLGLLRDIYGKLWYLTPLPNFASFDEFFAYIFQKSLESIDLIKYFAVFFAAAVSVLSVIFFFFTSNSRYANISFFGAQGALILSTYFGYSSFGETSYPYSALAFLFSQLFLLSIASFGFLEISYQASYAHLVGEPVLERKKKIEKQLQTLDAEARRLERKSEELASGKSSARVLRTESGTIGTFIREAMERSQVKKEMLRTLDAIGDVRRLQAYVDNLFNSDKEAKELLTATASAPSEGYVALSTFLGTIMRFIGVSLLVYIAVTPHLVLSLISKLTPLAESAEASQPEILLIIMVPLVLTIPFIAFVIGQIYGEEVSEEELKKKSHGKIKKRIKKKVPLKKVPKKLKKSVKSSSTT